MKYKKLIIYCVFVVLVGSLIGVKLYTNKKNSMKSKVVTNYTQNNKTNTITNNTKTTEGLRSAVSSTQASLETSKLDITMVGTTPNTEGNTSGNLSNGGYFAKQGKWIYFTLPTVNYKQYPIYRSMADGQTGLKAITKEGNYRCFNAIGDWLYYIGDAGGPYIYRTKTDGSLTEMVVKYPVFNMFIKGNFIYYSSPDGLYKLKLDSSKEDRGTLIAKGSFYNYFYIFDNLIYTPIYEPNMVTPANDKGQIANKGLYTMKLDGSNFKKLTSERIYRFIIYNDYIFYVGDYYFYRMNLNGSNKIQLFSYSVFNFNIYNNNIYYEGYGENQNNIYKSDLNGKRIVKLTNNNNNPTLNFSGTDSIYNISILDDYIFYLSLGSQINLYEVKIDGSLEKQLN